MIYDYSKRDTFICKECGSVTPQEFESNYKKDVCVFCDKEHYNHTLTEEKGDNNEQETNN